MEGTLRIPSLIQGITQQSAADSSPSSAKYQENCYNDPLKGSIARNGTTVLASWAGTMAGSFVHEVIRSRGEEYLIIIDNGGVLRVINRVSGEMCTVDGDISAYLSAFNGEAESAFSAVTIEEYTLIANRQVYPQKSSVTLPARSPQGIAHFKAGGYSTTYKIKLTVSSTGTSYEASYTTPDNSTAENADYIATNTLAEEFTTALATPGLLPAGFTVERRGSSILIEGPEEFTLSTEDGLGGQQFIAFTSRVKKFTDLPISNWDGYLVAVGPEEVSGVDYFIKWEGPEQDGEWVEVAKWGTSLGLDASTMPHVLKNTGLNTFVVEEAPWGDRLAGDGEDSSVDPSFLDRPIVDMQFVSSRLAIITESSYTLSRSRNAFVFYPDTAQTTLKTDPIDYTVTNGKVTIISGSVVQDGELFLWADGVQIKVTSGQEIFSEETVEGKASTSFEYDGVAPVLPIGKASVIYSTNLDGWASLTEVIYQNGNAVGELPLTDHCTELLLSDVNRIRNFNKAKGLVVTSKQAKNSVYIYQSLDQGQERVQSSWNVWTFPSVQQVVWAGGRGLRLYFLFDWGGVCTLETMKVDYQGGQEGVPLRSDHTVSGGTWYQDATDGYWTLTLPYNVPAEHQQYFVAYCAEDETSTGLVRGTLYPVVFTAENEVRVYSTATYPPLFGRPPFAYREFLEVTITDDKGEILWDTINIQDCTISHTDTVYYKIRAVPFASNVSETSVEFSSRLIGNPAVLNDFLAVDPQGKHKLERIGKKPGEFRLILENDSIYPSVWRAAEFTYRATKRVSR